MEAVFCGINTPHHHDTESPVLNPVDLEAGVNFVFGTTGGDRDALMKVTQESGVYAVIEAWTSMILLCFFFFSFQ